MSRQHLPEELKIEGSLNAAILSPKCQLSRRILYQWLKRYDPKRAWPTKSADRQAEIHHLKAELKQGTEERGIQKAGAITIPVNGSSSAKAACR